MESAWGGTSVSEINVGSRRRARQAAGKAVITLASSNVGHKPLLGVFRPCLPGRAARVDFTMHTCNDRHPRMNSSAGETFVAGNRRVLHCNKPDAIGVRAYPLRDIVRADNIGNRPAGSGKKFDLNKLTAVA